MWRGDVVDVDGQARVAVLRENVLDKEREKLTDIPVHRSGLAYTHHGSSCTNSQVKAHRTRLLLHHNLTRGIKLQQCHCLPYGFPQGCAPTTEVRLLPATQPDYTHAPAKLLGAAGRLVLVVAMSRRAAQSIAGRVGTMPVAAAFSHSQSRARESGAAVHEGSKLQLLLESANITHKAEQASAETVASTGKREKWQNCGRPRHTLVADLGH